MAPVGTVDEVVASLERLESTLPVSDGVHWFNRMYRRVTLAVRDYLAHHTQEAPRFLERLVVFFGNAYFSAVDGAAANPPQDGAGVESAARRAPRSADRAASVRSGGHEPHTWVTIW